MMYLHDTSHSKSDLTSGYINPSSETLYHQRKRFRGKLLRLGAPNFRAKRYIDEHISRKISGLHNSLLSPAKAAGDAMMGPE
jgi:hypothetical protein